MKKALDKAANDRPVSERPANDRGTGDRKLRILAAVVDEYIRTGEPAGSAVNSETMAETVSESAEDTAAETAGGTGSGQTIAGYESVQCCAVYDDGFFIVVWMIKDPANENDSYYLCFEFDDAHSDLMACSSTFRTPEDQDK